MKHSNFTMRVLSLILIASIAASCSDNDTSAEDLSAEANVQELNYAAEADTSIEFTDDIATEVYEAQEFSDQNRSSAGFDFLPDCVTVTVVREQGYREITLDFSTEGCEVRGNVLSGQIVMTYTRNPEAEELLISKFFNAFYINDLLIEGSKSILKVRANDNGNPQYTRTVEMQLTWPDETVATRNGAKVKEWIEGFDTRFPSDNVYEITGNWTTTFRNGNTYSHSIQTPLRRAFVCRFIVSGTVRIDRPNVGGLMDFGDGSCDNLATFTTDDGEVIEITLRR